MVWAVAILALLSLQAAESFVEAGLKALDGERYDEAALAFEKATATDPEDYGAHFNLAYAYTMLGRPAEAIERYEKTLELKPGLYQAELNLGILLLDGQLAARAIPHLRRAAEQKPGEFRPNFYLAKALYAEADDAGAERAFKKAAAIDPAAADVQVGLGRAVFNQGRFEEAEPFYRRAAALDPDYRSFLVELGTRYEEKGKPERAMAIYEEFLDDPAVRERLGHLLFQANRFAEALPHLQAAVAQSPTAANRFALAATYIKSEQPDKAIPLLALALRDEPGNYELLMMYGRLLRDQRQFGLAAQQFQRAIQAKPDSQMAWSEFASMQTQLENFPQALAALDKVEALGNAPVSVHFFRAIILDKLRDREPALASYEKFLSLSKDQFPDEEFKARQRIIAIKRELRR